MGPSRSRRAELISASRFQEGSMNDRTSAAPPLHFLDAAQRAALERPVVFDTKSQPRPVSDDWADKQVKKNRLLGQMWDGVRGRLGFRKDGDEERGSRRRDKSRRGDREEARRKEETKIAEREAEDQTRKDGHIKEEKTQDGEQKVERPTREEVLANYHNLVASGFFSSHAIQSTRQPAPGTTTTCAPPSSASSTSNPNKTSKTSTSQNPSSVPTPQNMSRAPTPRLATSATPSRSSSPFKPKPASRHNSEGFDPQAATYDELVASGFFTPPAPPAEQPSPPEVAPAPAVSMGRTSRDYLYPPNFSRPRSTTPAASRSQSPVQSPTSADSRGTKRAVADSVSDDEDDDMARDPPTPKKKLRKSASRDMALPKLRNATTRKNILSRRSISGPHGKGKEYNNLARRVLGRLPGANARSSVEIDRRTEAPARRSIDERQVLQETHNTRILRSRKNPTESFTVVPNANRGVPKVPIIPEKFASFEEDRENMMPALGIRH